MSAEFFIDTNIFIDHLDTTDRRKHSRREDHPRRAGHGNACTSAQVVQECLNVALRKDEVALSVDAARSYLDAMLAPLMQSRRAKRCTTGHWTSRLAGASVSYDSPIVAGAMAAGFLTLLSEDLQHGQTRHSLR